MKMNNYIEAFTKHLKDALKIGRSSVFSNTKNPISSVLICGLGGSGIGGTILKDLLLKKTSIPLATSKGYSIPSYVNESTLVIACSYSGNTEETLISLKKCIEKKAQIAIITSGGKLKEIAEEKGFNHIVIPSGHPPRAMFGYGFTELFYVLKNYSLIDGSFENDFENAIVLLEKEHELIVETAKKISKKLYKTTPIIYVTDGFEGVAIRFRQQINENSKMLCWHHVIPEMNHNELLGWRTNVENLSVIYLRNKNDNPRNSKRIDVNTSIIKKYTNNISEVWSVGNSDIEKTLYHINLGDWISWFLSDLNNVDAIEIDVIDFLKNELSKF